MGHCCIGASPVEVGLEVEAAEPGFAVAVAGLERARICLRSKSLRNRRLIGKTWGLREPLGTLSRARIGTHCCHLLVRGGALGGRDWLFLFFGRGR